MQRLPKRYAALTEHGSVHTGVIASLKQRETAIALARTTVRFAVAVLAALLALGGLLGADRVETIAGASFVVILLAFAAQRFLMDVIAGLLMFHERWLQIGDTVVIDPWKIEGIVDDLTLGTVTVRSVGGDVMRVSNSEVKVVRVIPRGYRRVEIELFVTDAEAGRELVRQVADIVPLGPTHLIRAERGRPRGARGRAAPHPRDRGRPRGPRVARGGLPAEPGARTVTGRPDRPRARGHMGRREAQRRFARATRTPLSASRSKAWLSG